MIDWQASEQLYGITKIKFGCRIAVICDECNSTGSRLVRSPNEIVDNQMVWFCRRCINSKVTKRLWQNREYRDRMEAIWANPEYKSKLAVASKRQWANMENRIKAAAISRTQWIDPEYRAKVTIARTNSEYRANMSAAIKHTWSDPEYRSKMAAIYTNPEYRSKMAATVKQLWCDPEYRASATAIWSNPEYRARMISILTGPKCRTKLSAVMEQLWCDPEYRASASAAAVSLWRDPEYRSKRSVAIAKCVAAGKFNTYSKCKCGWHESTKIGKVRYRSSWELAYYQYLDDNIEVISYKPEPFLLPYHFNNMSLNYIPDIIVWYADNHQELIEIKPNRLLKWPKNIAKIEAGQEYCALTGMVFVVLTEYELSAMGVLQ